MFKDFLNIRVLYSETSINGHLPIVDNSKFSINNVNRIHIISSKLLMKTL